MRAKLINESAGQKNPVDIKKLKEYAKAIEILCNGEYGTVYYNEGQNHVFVNLGDANPFDTEHLNWFMKEAIAKNWKFQDQITITIENECGPKTTEEGWIKL